MSASSLAIRRLSASIDGKQVLSHISLRIRTRELHVLMGPNGSGKSSLAQVIAGNPKFSVTEGLMHLGRFNLLQRKPDERAKLGLFVSFQQPFAIAGVPITQFLRTALKERNASSIRPSQVRERLLLVMPQVGLPVSVIDREVHVGFSGGEQKRFELAQLFMLGANIAVLDEIDSGLDVDGIRRVAAGIEAQRKQGTGILLITHNPAIVSYLSPTKVHILKKGRLATSGGAAVAEQVAQQGY